ncbi:MAG: phosphopantothenoylcysteine decarboxylase [Planctomycetaceae bacterium]|nr:phosphopantothenoylcysteine decarboxylase [Planctomycetaceae bacterium]
MSLVAHEIVVGITGGIAAFKTAALVSKLVQDGVGVTVVMTEAACRFIGPPTFEALTGRPVYRTVFDNAEFPLGAHIGLAERARLLCVAPATADFIAKAAHGFADDLLSTLYLAFQGDVLVAPAMNTAMWEAPAVVRNVAQLREDGVTIVDPGEGWLSCRTKGSGRMAEPEAIRAAIAGAFASG